MVFLSFKACNPHEFIKKDGYRARLDIPDRSGSFMLSQLDGSSEIFMDIILHAIMDLAAEGKTIANVRYQGRRTRHWFQMVFPSIMEPLFYGISNHEFLLVGYLLMTKSVISSTRKVMGIALVKSCRGQGIGYHVVKHVQDNLDKMFQPTITELFFETTRDNLPMLAIGRKLGFKEDFLPDSREWGDVPANRVRLLWKKNVNSIQ
ncbi:MAG: GNAT family N-acetyltransferase [Candidatus Sigynarchaeota archaeon]